MKVFDIRLGRRDTFVVYFREENGVFNRITLETDKEHPLPCPSNLWDKKTNTFGRHSPPFYNKLCFVTYAIPKEDINDFFLIHIVELIRWGAENKLLDDPTLGPMNILILTKEWNEVFQVGFGLHTGEYPVIHQFAQKIVDRYMSLKVFW